MLLLPGKRVNSAPIADTDRKTGRFIYFNIGLLIYYKRNTQRFLIFFTSATLCDGRTTPLHQTNLNHTISNAYKYRASVFNESTEQKHLEQSWRAHPYNHRFFASGIAPGVTHGGLEMRGVTCLQYERCTF